MRKKSYGTLEVRAISGTYVVFLAFNMKEADANGLMGFAIQRTRLSDDETIWLRGNKRFPSCGITPRATRTPTATSTRSRRSSGPTTPPSRGALPLPRHPDVRPARRADGGPGHDRHDRHGAPARHQPRRPLEPRRHRVAGVRPTLPEQDPRPGRHSPPTSGWPATCCPACSPSSARRATRRYSLRGAIYEFALARGARRVPGSPPGRRRRQDRLPRQGRRHRDRQRHGDRRRPDQGPLHAAGQRQADAQQVHRAAPERSARLGLDRLDELQPQRAPRPAQRGPRDPRSPASPSSSSTTGPSSQPIPTIDTLKDRIDVDQPPAAADRHRRHAPRLLAAPRPRRVRLVDRAAEPARSRCS